MKYSLRYAFGFICECACCCHFIDFVVYILKNAIWYDFIITIIVIIIDRHYRRRCNLFAVAISLSLSPFLIFILLLFVS